MTESGIVKPTPTEIRALIEASPGLRIAVILPVFEGEDVESTEVLAIAQASDQHKMGYERGKVPAGRISYNIKTGKFEWYYDEGEYHRLGKDSYYFECSLRVHKSCSCVPMKLTEDIGAVVDEEPLGDNY